MRIRPALNQRVQGSNPCTPTTLGMRSQIFWFPDNFIARTTELSVPVAFVLDYGSSLC